MEYSKKEDGFSLSSDGVCFDFITALATEKVGDLYTVTVTGDSTAMYPERI